MRFRDLPIRRRMRLLVLAASGLALIVAGLGIVLYEITTVRPRVLRDLVAQAELVRLNSTAALQFRDVEAATENLQTMEARREIGAAAIYDSTGQLFASYVRPPGTVLPFVSLPSEGAVFDEQDLTLTQPMRQEGPRRDQGPLVGWLVLRYDFPPLWARLPQYTLLVSVVLLALLAVSFLLSRFLSTSISRPILSLAEASRAVALRGDYSVRAEKYGEDEVGRLTDAFNQMLATLKEREAALAERSRQLMEAMVAARMGSWSWSPATGGMTWGGEEERIFGADGRPVHPSFAGFLDIVHSADREGLESALQVTAMQAKPCSLDFRIVAPSGRVRWLAMTGHAVAAENGTVERVFGLVVDVTDRRHLEEQLVQSQKMEAIGRLAGGIAHDFNNLLTGILGYARFAMAGLKEGDRVRADVAEIERAGMRAASLTGQLLSYARRQMIAPKVTNLNDLVKGLQPMLQRLIGEDIVLEARSEVPLWSARVDPTQFEQVLLNLTVNARDAMRGGGQLVIETRNEVISAELAGHPEVTPGSYVKLTVTDNGTGMDAATQARIFEPFFTTKEQGKGTGLGLAVCYGIIAQAGGQILVSSEVNAGTRFTVLLPRASTDAPPGPAGEEQKTEAPRGTETLLVVEDEPLVRKLAVRVLAAQGYHVLEAVDGPTALDVAARHEGPIHSLVTDVVMPGMNGKELAAELGPKLPGLRVLFMSGYAEHAVVQHGVIEDGIAFLAKPFDPVMLARMVREVLDSRTGTPVTQEQ
ncbi:MAG: ATP-binding protein [Gemmatimonadota bacterium]